jgi:hypothetical protein
MSRFSNWTTGDWAVFGLYCLIVVLSIAGIVTAKGWARRKAIREGRVDADGDPIYDEENNPAANIRAGLILCAIGVGLIVWKLASSG